MDWASDMPGKRFRVRWRGFDPKEVELFVQQAVEEMQRLKYEHAALQRTMQDREREITEYRDREKTIRNVLLNVQKTVEQMKANAEREARQIVAEAEIKADKILQHAHQRLGQIQSDIAELKRHRVQLEQRLRSTLDAYSQLLDTEREDVRETEQENKVKYLNRPASS